MANTLDLYRSEAVGFIDWLDPFEKLLVGVAVGASNRKIHRDVSLPVALRWFLEVKDGRYPGSCPSRN